MPCCDYWLVKLKKIQIITLLLFSSFALSQIQSDTLLVSSKEIAENAYTRHHNTKTIGKSHAIAVIFTELLNNDSLAFEISFLDREPFGVDTSDILKIVVKDYQNDLKVLQILYDNHIDGSQDYDSTIENEFINDEYPFVESDHPSNYSLKEINNLVFNLHQVNMAKLKNQAREIALYVLENSGISKPVVFSNYSGVTKIELVEVNKSLSFQIEVFDFNEDRVFDDRDIMRVIIYMEKKQNIIMHYDYSIDGIQEIGLQPPKGIFLPSYAPAFQNQHLYELALNMLHDYLF